jgi:hypothetical protein
MKPPNNGGVFASSRLRLWSEGLSCLSPSGRATKSAGEHRWQSLTTISEIELLANGWRVTAEMRAELHDPDPKLPEPDPDPAEEEPKYPLPTPDEPGPDVINPIDPGVRPPAPEFAMHPQNLGGPRRAVVHSGVVSQAGASARAKSYSTVARSILSSRG